MRVITRSVHQHLSKQFCVHLQINASHIKNRSKAEHRKAKEQSRAQERKGAKQSTGKERSRAEYRKGKEQSRGEPFWRWHRFSSATAYHRARNFFYQANRRQQQRDRNCWLQISTQEEVQNGALRGLRHAKQEVPVNVKKERPATVFCSQGHDLVRIPVPPSRCKAGGPKCLSHGNKFAVTSVALRWQMSLFVVIEAGPDPFVGRYP